MALPNDHFIHSGGVSYAGNHLIADFWGAERLGDRDYMEEALIKAIEVAGATLLHIHLHRFSDGGGISGVAVLAESHISVHTWPERSYAAFDIFMCGDARPDLGIAVLKSYFKPSRIVQGNHKRGVV